MTSDDATTARRKAMAAAPRFCGECGWFDAREFACMWECLVPVPVWMKHDGVTRLMNPLYDASKCDAWKLAEAADVAAESTRKEAP